MRRCLATGRLLLLGLLGAGVTLSASTTARAQTSAKLTTLHSFNGDSDGYSPNALLQASDGNFYGTTAGGGAHFLGSVFKMTPAGVFTTLYSFSGATDGSVPGGGLALGRDGNLYGETRQGGVNHEGTIYKITPAGSFTLVLALGGTGGAAGADFLLGKDGNFYGTTNGGGTLDGGTVYKLTPTGTVTVLYNFGNVGDEHNTPFGYLLNTGLAQGSDGNFYGTSYAGGANDAGVFFKITPAGAVTALYSFQPNNEDPTSTLVQGSDGNFYGVTGGDGTNGKGGTVIRLTPAGAETVVHTFAPDDNAGATDNSPLLLGSDGNLYGLTQVGGANDDGTLYEISASGEFTNVYNFSGSDGSAPGNAPLVQGADGSLYGVTLTGGDNDSGTIFKVTLPVTHPSFFKGEVALGSGAYYLSFPNSNYFGYYSYLSDPRYIYHFDLGYEYLFDAADGKSGVYFYDFKSKGYFYTSPTFPFPYLYDFTLKSVVYYYPDPKNAGHYNTNGVRYFYVFNTGKIISK